MSKSATINSWLSSSLDGDDDGDGGEGGGDSSSGIGYAWSREKATSGKDEEWVKAMEFAQAVLLRSKTSRRVAFMQEELGPLAKSADLSLSQTMDIFRLLTLTYTRFHDGLSRDAAEDLGMQLVQKDQERDPKLGVTEQVVGWLSVEVGRIAKRGTHAYSNLFVLHSWAARLYALSLQKDADAFTSQSTYTTLVGCMAVLLDLLYSDPSGKPSMKKGVTTRARRAVRSAPKQIPDVTKTLLKLTKASGQNPLTFVPLLGVSVDVTLRLKDESLAVVPTDIKTDILALFTSSLLMAKTTVPSHTITALHDFFQSSISEDDFKTVLRPAIEKSLLRSPEYSLSVIAHLFTAYTHPLDTPTFKALLTPLLSCAKSTNPMIRTGAISAFSALMKPRPAPTSSASSPSSEEQQNLSHATTDLLSLPKAGKTSGPEHRLTLYTMLSSLPASPASSPLVVQTLPSLLAKETHEQAVGAMAGVLPKHVGYMLSSGTGVEKDVVGVITKEMAGSKAGVRRAVFKVLGEALWASNAPTSFTPSPSDEAGEEDKPVVSDATIAFMKDVLPALQATLKTVTTNPLTATNAGPFEGFVALALLLGPVAGCAKFDDIISNDPSVQGIPASTTSNKPSFLLWEKVYQKVTEEEDERWLLRAVKTAVSFFSAELGRNEVFRTQLGLVLVHFALNTRSPKIRKEIPQVLASLTHQYPGLTNKIVRDGLSAHISKASKPSPLSTAKSSSTAADSTANVVSGPVMQQGLIAPVLLACVDVGERLGVEEKEGVLSELVVLAHHELSCRSKQQTWIDLVMKAGVDPHELVTKRAERILELVFAASEGGDKTSLAEAAYAAVQTLVFVAPEAVLPRMLEQLKMYLNPAVLNDLSDEDLAIWATPEGALFKDVLALKKDDAQPVKGKGTDIAKWEAEVRKSLANKKGSATVSKQDQALIDAQLKLESSRRDVVEATKSELERGLLFVKSLVASRGSGVDAYVSELCAMLLEGPLGRGAVLVGGLAFETYIDLASCCSDRLDTFRKWVGIASLRALGVSAVPADLEAEPLGQLVVRVLYRLRSLSEQTPFDAPTFSYAFPLLNKILLAGGVGLAKDQEEETLEQLSLALDIVKFHAGEFANHAYPRQKAMHALLTIVRQAPKLSKTASSALVDVGEAVSATATREEMDTLIEGTLLQEVYVRSSALQALQPFDLTDLDWSPALWVACHDEDEQNARLARHVWEDNGLDAPEMYLDSLLHFLGHQHAYVRAAAAESISEAVVQYPQTVTTTLTALEGYYREKAKILAPEFDQFGMLIAQSVDQADPWPARQAVARTLELLAPALSQENVVYVLSFLIKDEALGDREAVVRKAMLTAGSVVVDLHGKACLPQLILMFEKHLSQSSPATETGDHIKEAVVILFGRLARHLDASDQRINAVVDRLVDALKTPSEQVQIAVSECISPLVSLMGERLTALASQLLDDSLNAAKYSGRRGAAYGLSGVVHGAGIGAIQKLELVPKLQAATEDKKKYESRQGAMFVFETLSNSLGRLFEPYVTNLLPLLLACFGDAVADVREATQDAARVVMANLSGYGLKLILPSLLSGLDEKQWRTKKGSIELLGMMAYCSPKQLSLSLPIVIPRLTDVLTDSHAQVRTAANKSLKQFGEVISNPEIQTLVPTLLKALVDPAKTPNALSGLLKTSFMHYIDHSSLALVVPIIERGLRERGAETKKKAAQIVGNLASLTESKDFVPYLAQLLPLVHVVLIDPVPEARATAAKALGTLVERLGEVHFPDLVPNLLRTLKTDTSGVDRQGAAQGLSEVLSGLGMERLEGLLPDILANAQSPRSTVKEGFMSLLVYLPATFGTRFQPHLPKIIAPILGGLSDTEESVREAAMRAGRMVVTNYSTKAIDLLLPELEQGLFDPAWRIRQSSITLVGELLFKVSGITARADIDDEEVAADGSVDSSKRALVEVLGSERRDRILSALYLIRQDGVSVVRQSSIQIWKTLVNNTPRTVREIMPELMNQIIFLISGDEFEQQEIASRTTGELCRKFGERVVGEIVSILKEKSSSTDPRTREGACLTVSDMMEFSSETSLEDHADTVISIVRECLVDDEGNVRVAAAKAFDTLQEHLGVRAIDETIPTLLEALRQPGKGSGTALQALQEVMSVRASTVFPVLIPTLTAIPMTVFNARALAALVTVAGNALSRRLTTILGALVKVVEEEKDEELLSAADEALRALLSSVSDSEGLNTLMMLLIGWAKHDSPRRRVTACNFFSLFCELTEMDYAIYRVDWVRQLIPLMEDSQLPVHTAALAALESFIKGVPKPELQGLAVPLRRSIESTGSPGHHVPGFSLPKGVAPMVPIIIAGLTTGTNEQQEQAAYAIGDLVERTEETAFKPYVVPFTGPLIRVATQSATYPPAVKTSILSALTSMLIHIPAFVKPFFPQLQRTFVKSSGDPSSAVVRLTAARALGALMRHQPRVDPVVTELITSAKSSEGSIASSMVFSLSKVVASGSANLGDKAQEACVELIEDAFRSSRDETYGQSIAQLFRSLSSFPQILLPIVNSYLIPGTPPSPISSHTILASISPDDDEDKPNQDENVFQSLGLQRSVAQKVLENAANERSNISRPARDARDLLKASSDPSLAGLF